MASDYLYMLYGSFLASFVHSSNDICVLVCHMYMFLVTHQVAFKVKEDIHVFAALKVIKSKIFTPECLFVPIMVGMSNGISACNQSKQVKQVEQI